MKRKYLGLAALCSVCAFSLSAQNVVLTGQVYSQATFNHTDILKLSQFNNGFGTARSSAMGGAFTSLGADLSSMNINPAGLGMYRSSEVGITLGAMFGKMDNSSPSMIYQENNGKSRFAPNNVGMALNIYEGTGDLTSFTFGFSYNKLADFNHRSRVGIQADFSTIGDIFVRQLQGLNSSALSSNANLSPWNNTAIPVMDWGAVLGYQSWMMDEYTENTWNPDRGDYPGPGNYYTAIVAHNAEIEHAISNISTGSIGEYSISGGFNLRNTLYLGFSIGLQSIYMKQEVWYDEYYLNNGAIENANNRGVSMHYDQYKKLNGAGVNLKLGAIYRPVSGLRIGLALHTPTMASVEMEYAGYMETITETNALDPGWGQTNYNIYDYEYTTPTRLMGGISYTFGETGVVSIDYERTWYNGMRYSNGDQSKDWYTREIKHLYQGGNTVRFGAEVKPVPAVALRAGASWSGSIMNEDNFKINTDALDSPFTYENYNISGGVGFRLGKASNLDLAYVFMQNKFNVYDIYYYYSDGVDEFTTGNITQKLNRHNVMLTLGFRF